MNEYPSSLQAKHLMEHMQALCKDIGPRPSTSEQERQAADYVEQILQHAEINDIHRQPFKSQNSLGWVEIPSLVAGMLGTALASAGPLGKLIGSALLLGSAHTMRQGWLIKPIFFQKLIAHGNSQNVVAKIPAAKPTKRTIYLVGHLDSQKQRFLFPFLKSPLATKIQMSLPILSGLLGGSLLLADVLLKRHKKPWWRWSMGAIYAYGLISALLDETQPYVEGANDNATAVSLLLGMAQALKVQPLQHTDVVLLFTGCEESGCVGMESYLQAFAPPTDNTYWIDVEMVGTGDLCYITQHGVSYLTQYKPHPEMITLAEHVAQKHPQLGVKGKDMVIIEEVANLQNRGYKAMCLAGYDEKGALPNWHRLSDNLDNIEADTLSRAALYTWELMREIDQQK